MTTSFNPSVNNNTFLRPSLLQQEPKFDMNVASRPIQDAAQPQATVGNLVPPNSAAEVSSASVQERTVASEIAQAPQSAPEASAATGENLVDLNWHSYFPKPVGNALNPNPQPSAPFHGFPHEFSNRSLVGVHELTDVVVAKNNYDPNFIPAGVIGHTLNVPQNEANAITRLASGDRNPNPVASAGQFYNLLASRGTHQSPVEIQKNAVQLGDTGNWNQHFNPQVNGMDFNGFNNAMSDRGTPERATYGNYLTTARIDPTSDPWTINVSDLQRGGVRFAANGDFSLSEFGNVVDRHASVPNWQPLRPWQPSHEPRPVTPSTFWRNW